MDAALWTNWQLGVDPEETLVCVCDVAMARGVAGETWDRLRAAPGRTKVLVVGNHDVTGQGLLRVEGFHRVKAVLTSPGDPPLIWTQAPLPNVPAGHVNIHGHQHRALKPSDSPHINVSVEQLAYRPVSLVRLPRSLRPSVSATMASTAVQAPHTALSPRNRTMVVNFVMLKRTPLDGDTRAPRTMSTSLPLEHSAAMIRSIQARGYRCLRHVDLRLDNRFHVLVGPNGSGKSTLFDAINFLFDVIRHNVETAVANRTRNFQDLVWGRPNERPGFELAMEVDLPSGGSFRYEIAVRESPRGVSLTSESGYLGRLPDRIFESQSGSDSVFTRTKSRDLRRVFNRLEAVPEESGRGSRTTFYLEQSSKDRRSITFHHREGPSIRLVPAVDQFRFHEDRGSRSSKSEEYSMPMASEAVRQLMQGSIQPLQLDSRLLRSTSPLNGDEHLRLSADGSNVPWIIETFRQEHKSRFASWLQHLRTALPEISDIRAVRRDEDRHAYLMVRYASGVEVPAWCVSEGTLRLLVLTLLAYLPTGHPFAYLLEEPENGIHPMAIETAYQSLSSVYDAQVFVASHSPNFLRCIKPAEVLCFARDVDGATIVTRGDRHPKLAEWQESVDIDLLFASEILA